SSLLESCRRTGSRQTCCLTRVGCSCQSNKPGKHLCTHLNNSACRVPRCVRCRFTYVSGKKLYVRVPLPRPKPGPRIGLHARPAANRALQSGDAPDPGCGRSSKCKVATVEREPGRTFGGGPFSCFGLVLRDFATLSFEAYRGCRS